MVYDQRSQEFYPKKGPLFANLVLADEINRAPAKVQSALLEAMQEKQVTIGGETFFLGEPFLVLATQNPIEHEGTYPLPEAQLDRFMLKVKVGYPGRDAEKEIVARMASGRPIEVERVADADGVLAARSAIAELFMDQKVVDYVVDVVRATREPEAVGLRELKTLIAFGASPRASIYLAQAARAHAYLRGRSYVVPEDVKAMAYDVLRHRVLLTFEAEAEDTNADREIALLLVVDQSGSLHFGAPYTKAGLAVEVAAVLALAAARHSDRVGAVLFADRVEYVIRPAKGRSHALRVIRDLVAFRPRGRGTNLAEGLRYAAKLVRHRGIVVVLSDFRAEGWEEPLAMLQAEHDVVAISVDDAREIDVPDAGWVELEDAETGRRVLLNSSDPAARHRILAAATQHVQERQKKLTRAGVDHISLHTHVPYGVPL